MEGFIVGALTSVIVSLGYYGFKKLEDKQAIKIRLIVFGAVFAMLIIADIIISCVDGTCAMSLVFLLVFSWRIVIDIGRLLSTSKKEDNTATDTISSNKEEPKTDDNQNKV